MADEYIKKSRALELIQEERDYMTRRQSWAAEHILVHCGLRIIDDMQPEPDVVKVVRCGNCTYWNRETHGCTRNPSISPWEERDFCRYGSEE